MVKVFRAFIISVFLVLQAGIGGAQESTFNGFEDTVISQNQFESVTVSSCDGCTGCSSGGGFELPFQEFPFVLLVIVVFVLLVVKKNKMKVLFWTVGLTLFAAVIFNIAKTDSVEEHKQELALEISSDTGKYESTTYAENDFEEFQELEDEFEPVEGGDEFISVDSDDEFLSVSDDEFGEFSETDEFLEFDEDETGNSKKLSDGERNKLIRTLIVLLATVISGIAIRAAKTRKIRFVILLASLVYLGFYSGGCPCMISSFQNLALLLMGESTHWINLVWILGLLPITYFFGKVWCGWVCHLGAMQEFLYRPGKNRVLLNSRVQRAFKIAQVSALAALLVQLLITRTNLFIKIDPFKVIFNLFSPNVAGYVLLAVLLVSSLLIYRPFCRTLCPVGLVLGWIEKIPGAAKLKINSNCKSCNKCVKECSYQAIEHSNGEYSIDNSECIRCGDCLDSCKFKAVKL